MDSVVSNVSLPRRPSLELRRLLDDPFLAPYRTALERRRQRALDKEAQLTGGGRMSLADFASGHEYFGCHRRGNRWIFREWAPYATGLWWIGERTQWKVSDRYAFAPIGEGCWQLDLPGDALAHGDLYRLQVQWPGGEGARIPAWTRRVVYDPGLKIFNAQVWHPLEPYRWRHPVPPRPSFPMIYEAHIGMAQEREGIGTYDEFMRHVLPRIVGAGYNVLQLMAIMEHPYYGSFGYHVANFFAASSRYGSPEDLKALVDAAHGAGLWVIMDLVHSHAVRNEVEGISRYDGTLYQFFHDGPRGYHAAWDSRCFDYGKPQVLHFLLSNCRFWLDEFRFDGFRFDGVTSMLYLDHGLGRTFDSYEAYFHEWVDEDAVTYLTLANRLIHTVRPDALTIAEDVSGMPGLAAPLEDGGLGFDFRLAMGVPDCWFRLLRTVRDEDWPLGHLWHELTNRRADERTVSYVESHDQAIVGGQTAVFRLMGARMYDHMREDDPDPVVERGMALHKMIRLATVGTAGHGYLNFMGNEFGHPEWIDFPREGNGWSFRYARRQWSLRDASNLKYRFLAEFDRSMIRTLGAGGERFSTPPRLIGIDEERKVLTFERGGYVVVCNFHPTGSWVDYPIEVPKPAYRLILDTDEPRFGGQGRLVPDQVYYARAIGLKGAAHRGITVYAPARTALVLEPLCM